MNPIYFVALAMGIAGCDVHVHNPPDQNTTVEEKKVEKNTTIVNPPAKEEKNVEKNTTIVNPPPAPAPAGTK